MEKAKKQQEDYAAELQKSFDRKRLYDDLWSKGIPTILTSGTMSAAGDFSISSEPSALSASRNAAWPK